MADIVVGLPFDVLLGQGGPSSAGPVCCAEEALLVAGLRESAEEAYETLIVRYQQPVYGLIYRLLSDPSEAADVTQEVFLKIFRSIGSFRSQSSLRTWIYRIAVNEAYNHRRWFSRRQRHEMSAGGEEDRHAEASSFTAPGRNPFELAADGETRALVEQALSKLNANFRAAVVLRDIEELSYEEIASILETSLGTVKSRILRGREALRKILTDSLEPQANLNWTRQRVEFAKPGE